MKLKIMLTALGVVVVAVVACIVCYFVPIIKVSTVTVTGASVTGVDAVRAASGLRPGENMLRVDLGEASKKVVALPWVKKATVIRDLPSTIKINVTERHPAFFVHRPDGDHLVDGRGVAFVIAPHGPGVVELIGLNKDDHDTFVSVARLLDAIPDDLRGRIGKVKATNPFTMELVTGNGHTIVVGSDEKLPAKMVALRVALDRPEKWISIEDPNMMATKG